MNSGTGPEETHAARRPRRAVRAPGTVGTDDALLRSTLPALGDGAAPETGSPAGAGDAPSTREAGAPAPAAPGAPATTGDAALLNRSADDSDVGWGERADSNDDRLRQDKPPHW